MFLFRGVGSWVFCNNSVLHSDRFGGQKAYIIWRCSSQVLVDVHGIIFEQAVVYEGFLLEL